MEIHYGNELNPIDICENQQISVLPVPCRPLGLPIRAHTDVRPLRCPWPLGVVGTSEALTHFR